MKSFLSSCIVAGAAAGLLAACASGAHRRAGERDTAGMAAALRDAAQARASYRLAPDDVVSVGLYPDRELGTRARVDADGSISVPMAGAVKVSGLTLAEAQRAIEQRLTSYYVRPQVSLFVESTGNKVLFVLGEVQKPGPYPIAAGTRMTILEAITAAGGFTKVAAPRRAHVLRSGGSGDADIKIDLKDLLKRGDRSKDMLLEPNDVVYVPQTLL